MSDEQVNEMQVKVLVELTYSIKRRNGVTLDDINRQFLAGSGCINGWTLCTGRAGMFFHEEDDVCWEDSEVKEVSLISKF